MERKNIQRLHSFFTLQFLYLYLCDLLIYLFIKIFYFTILFFFQSEETRNFLLCRLSNEDLQNLIISSAKNMSFNIPFITSDSVKSKIDSNSLSHGSVTDCFDKSKKDLDSLMVEKLDKDELPEKNRIIFKSNATQTFISPSIVHEQPRRTKRSLHKEEELHVLALSEAQMKVDIAAMLKEEARIKLEEAHYRKEEARLRMLLFTYKLDRIKED